MKVFILCLVALTITGCRTEAYWVQKRYNPKGGVVEYPNGGLSSNLEKRVIDAKQKMENFCAPEKATVNDESYAVQNDGSLSTYNPTTGQVMTTPMEEEHTRIGFICEPEVRMPASN